MTMGIGGVRHHTILDCPECGNKVIIPPGMILRIPHIKRDGVCHEVVNPHTGKVVK